MVDDDTGKAGPDPVGDKINHLIRTMPRPKADGGTLYSVREVAEGIGVSKQHLYSVIASRTRASWELVQQVAEFYGVSLVYFDNTEAADRYAEQLQVLGALGLAKVTDVQFRSGVPLSSKSSRLLLDFAKHLQDVEGGHPDDRDAAGADEDRATDS